MSIKNIPLVAKVLSILGALALVTVASLFYTTSNMQQIGAAYAASIAQQGRTALYLARANRALNGSRAAIGDLLVSTTDEGNERALADMDKTKASFISFMRIAGEADVKNLTGVGSLQKRGLELMEKTCAHTIDLAKVATETAAVMASQLEFRNSCSPGFAPLVADVTAAVDKATKDQEMITSDLADATSRTVWTSFGVVLGGLLVVLAGSFIAVRRWISGPIDDLTGVMNRLAGGEFSLEISASDRRDEIGLMARAVQVFKDNGLKLQASKAEAAHMRDSAERERNSNEAERARVVAEQARVVGALAVGLERLSDGKLVFRIEDRFAPDYEKLRTDFNAAMATLEQTMTLVSTNAVAIRSGTSEISTAADDLSRRTEQQAASLEQTAAALDEITATVRRTAEGSHHAREVVGAAKRDTEHSSRVVRQAIEAMSGIETSANQIGNIIGVIDEIAFQTNLLALNAGVEAARAGEAGRGFAVVASEVRALAQRSAEAAKEIKTLIAASGSQVALGVSLVDETGRALARIATQVVEINDIVAAIAASAQEQATGLDQVNTAVNQMDQVTQQNAAMVEESTAASHALAQETEELSRLIGRFAVGGRGSADPHRARQPGSPKAA